MSYEIQIEKRNKDGTKKEIPITMEILELTSNNGYLLLKILEKLGTDLESEKYLMSTEYFQELVLRIKNVDKVQYYTEHPEEYLIAMDTLQNFCEKLLNKLKGESIGFDIYKFLEENSDVYLSDYEVKPLPIGPNSYPDSTGTFRWWTGRDMLTFLKNEAFKAGLIPIPLYSDEKKKKPNKDIDSVIRNLDLLVWTVKTRKKTLGEEIEKQKKQTEWYNTRVGEYQKYLQSL